MKAKFQRTTSVLYRIEYDGAKAAMGSRYSEYIEAKNIVRTHISKTDHSYYQNVKDMGDQGFAVSEEEMAKNKYIVARPNEHTPEEIQEAQLFLDTHVSNTQVKLAEILLTYPQLEDAEYENYKAKISDIIAKFPDEVEIIEDFAFWLTDEGQLYNEDRIYGNGDSSTPRLTIKLDGTVQVLNTEANLNYYNTYRPGEINITPESINASRNNHRHDASHIVSGVLDIARIPRGAIERCVIVKNDEERFALTTEEVQKGDTVKVTYTKKMYLVIDDSKLDQEAGYTDYISTRSIDSDQLGGIPAEEYPTLTSTNTLLNKTLVFPVIDKIKNNANTFTFPSKGGTFALVSDRLANPYKLLINLNGTTSEYDGSVEKSITINPSTVGASPSNHLHDDRYLRLIGGTLTISSFYGLNVKRSDTNGSGIQFSNSAGALAGVGVLSDKTFVVSLGSATDGGMFKVTSTGRAFAGGTELSKITHTHNYAGSSSPGGAATSANKVNSALTIQLNGGTTDGTNRIIFDGSSAKSLNITPASIGASANGHTHNYAGSSSPGGAATSANKVNSALTINNSAGQAQLTFDGSSAKVLTLTPSMVGAAPTSHTHNYAGSSSPGGAANQTTGSLSITIDGGSAIVFNGSANKSISINTGLKTVSWDIITGKPETATRWPSWNEITSKPSSFTPSSHSHDWSQITGKPSSYTPSAHSHSALTLQINGTTQTTYTADSTKTFNVTLSALGGAIANHNHDHTYVKFTSDTGINNGSFSMAGSITASTFYKNSDKRIKRNIKEVDSNIAEKSLNIEVKTFDQYLNLECTEGKFAAVGYIADEIEELMPCLVSKDIRGIKKLDYNGIEALQIQGLKLKLLKAEEKIKELEKTISLLVDKYLK